MIMSRRATSMYYLIVVLRGGERLKAAFASKEKTLFSVGLCGFSVSEIRLSCFHWLLKASCGFCLFLIVIKLSAQRCKNFASTFNWLLRPWSDKFSSKSFWVPCLSIIVSIRISPLSFPVLPSHDFSHCSASSTVSCRQCDRRHLSPNFKGTVKNWQILNCFSHI